MRAALVVMMALAASATLQAKERAPLGADATMRPHSSAASAALLADGTAARTEARAAAKKSVSMYTEKEAKDAFEVPLIKDAKQLTPSRY